MSGKESPKNEYLAQWIIILAGVIFVVFSFFLQDRWFSVFCDIGASLVVSGLIAFFLQKIHTEEEKGKEKITRWGIKNIYETRTVANVQIDICQEKAKRQIDVIAFGLSSWINNKAGLIDKSLQKKVKIRIITVHPDNSYLKARDISEGKPQGATRKTIIQLDEFFSKTDARRKNTVIKFHKNLPLDFYFRVDDHLFVGPYLFGKDSQQMITYEYEKGGAGFQYYTEYFESLWNENSGQNLIFEEYKSKSNV